MAIKRVSQSHEMTEGHPLLKFLKHLKSESRYTKYKLVQVERRLKDDAGGEERNGKPGGS